MKTKAAQPLPEIYCRTVLPVNGHNVTFTVQAEKITSAHAKELVEWTTNLENELRKGKK